ncbi:hypothetical protein [Pigmentiphaga sp. CHJ604]|uniref:hypothetical protein n=1 Tax=Pigmentiphaga sp. CHJ604 TaxID=3081984 RepID=UPI0030CEA7FD
MDWDLVIKIATPVITLGLGALITRVAEERARVTAYLGHATSTLVRPLAVPELPQHSPAGQAEAAPAFQPFYIFTHTIVVTNPSRKPVTNLVLGHQTLPNFSVHPDTYHEVRKLPGGGTELVFPKLGAKKQITIAYLYQPPLIFSGINTSYECDAGPVRILAMIPSARPPRPIMWALWFILLYGVGAIIYTILQAV